MAKKVRQMMMIGEEVVVMVANKMVCQLMWNIQSTQEDGKEMGGKVTSTTTGGTAAIP